MGANGRVNANHSTRVRSLLAVAVCGVLAACSGGSTGVTPAPHSAAAIPPHPTQTVANATFTIHVPAAASQGTRRRPQYVSADTASISIAVNGGTAVVSAITPTSPGCTSQSSGFACTISDPAPVGSDTFVLSLLDAHGNVLSTGTVPETVRIGMANSFAVTLGGVVASLSLSLATAAPPANGQAQTIALMVNALDAAGAVIVGPGNYSAPISIADSDTSGVTSMQIGSSAPANPLTITVPGTGVTVNYSGTPLSAGATFTASVPGTSVTKATVTLAPVPVATVVLSSTSLTLAAGTIATFTASEASYSGTFTVTPVGSTTNAVVTPSSATAGSQQFIIGGVATGMQTFTVADSASHTATLTVNVTAAASNVTVIKLPTASPAALNGESSGAALAFPDSSTPASGYVAVTWIGTAPGTAFPVAPTLPPGSTAYFISVMPLNTAVFGSPIAFNVNFPANATSLGEQYLTPQASSWTSVPGSQPCTQAAAIVTCTFTQPSQSASIPISPGASFGFVIDATPPVSTVALNAPNGLAFDTLGDLYVANTGANQVVEFTAAQLASSQPAAVPVIPSVTNPTRIALDPTRTDLTIWVTCTSANAVEAFSLSSPATPTTTITQSVNRPLGIAVEHRGFVYVGNNGDDSISVYHNAGGAPAFHWTMFATPATTAFTAPGALLYVRNDPFAGQFDGAIYIGLGGSVEGVYVFTADSLTGSGPYLVRSFTASSVSGPTGLAVTSDASTTVYVANYYTTAITGYSIATPGTQTYTQALASQPQGLAVDPSGNIYVSLPGSNSISEYSGSTGTFVRALH